MNATTAENKDFLQAPSRSDWPLQPTHNLTNLLSKSNDRRKSNNWIRCKEESPGKNVPKTLWSKLQPKHRKGDHPVIANTANCSEKPPASDPTRPRQKLITSINRSTWFEKAPVWITNRNSFFRDVVRYTIKSKSGRNDSTNRSNGLQVVRQIKQLYFLRCNKKSATQASRWLIICISDLDFTGDVAVLDESSTAGQGILNLIIP